MTADDYRDRARDLYEEARVSHDPTFIHRSIQVTRDAHVHVVEDGAFVEAVVWVPRDQVVEP